MWAVAAASVLVTILPAPGLARDLSDMIVILEDRFEDGLRRYDGQRGVWSTLPRRGRLMTNAAEAVFLDRGVLPAESDALLPDLHVVTPEGLSLRTAALPEEVLPAVHAKMAATGQGDRARNIRFATSQINTSSTWSQTYGYFEIRARLPRGKGRWPAFWMTFAGPGWPPEIDVFEAYGEGIRRPTPKDGLFKTAVIFDAYDDKGEKVHSVDLKNPHDADGPDPVAKPRGKRDIYIFGEEHRDHGADIYDSLHTYAVEWGPQEIVFYFGKTREDLREIYRVPTPEDAHVPMYVIANDQFTARGGWWSPREAVLAEVLDPANDFLVESITIAALPPNVTVEMVRGDTPTTPHSSLITDTPGDDIIAPGAGFDVVTLTGGADEILLHRGRESNVISGFGEDDRLVLQGFRFADVKDILARLTQVGDDVWLSAIVDPFWPQTVVFRDTSVDAFSEGQFELR